MSTVFINTRSPNTRSPRRRETSITLGVLVLLALLALGIGPRIVRNREAREVVEASTVLLPEVTVVHAQGSGDDTLIAVTTDTTRQVTLVSADRALRQRAEALGADVASPGWLIDLLDG